MSKCILVIDDEDDIIEVFQMYLDDHVDRIVTAKTVREAISKIAETDFNIIFIDINLGGQNGAEIIKELRSNSDNRNFNTPIIIQSGYVTDDFASKHMDDFAGILSKPFSEGDIVTLTQLLLIDELGEVPKIDRIHLVKVDKPFEVPGLQQKVEKFLETISNMPQVNDFFKKIKPVSKDNFIEAHIGLLINICAAISLKLSWVSKQTLEKFIFAAYLHDIALDQKPHLARINNKFELENFNKDLTDEDKNLVLDHPDIVSEMIKSCPEIHSDVKTIILQHHELPDGSGFPHQIGHKRITPFAALFIVAEDIVKYLHTNSKWNLEAYLKKSKSKFKGAQFHQIMSALTELTY